MTEWKKAKLEIEFREVEKKTHIRTHLPSGVEVWGEVIEQDDGPLLFGYPDQDYVIRYSNGECEFVSTEDFHTYFEVIE